MTFFSKIDTQNLLWRSRLKGLIVLVLVVSGLLTGCNSSTIASPPPSLNTVAPAVIKGKLSEVATPPLIEQLAVSLDQYQPQVKILSPQPEAVLQDTSVAVKLSVQDLPLFQNSELEMGPHLHLIVDNQPYQAIYDVNEPIILKDLEPGTHTLRAFPVRPWHESFKNDGAYAQTTFHVLTKSSENRPDPALPLLTYSRPKGSYGAEPILLDFYLTNAPLHLVAQEDQNDAIADWRIRVTINDESFLLDHWQSVYLKGFEQGKNWVKLEFIDEQGNPIPNTFNNTVRVIDYQPKGQDTLSKLVRGELSPAIAKTLVDQNAIVPVVTTPEVTVEILKPTSEPENPVLSVETVENSSLETESSLEKEPILENEPILEIEQQEPKPDPVQTQNPADSLSTVSPITPETSEKTESAISPSPETVKISPSATEASSVSAEHQVQTNSDSLEPTL